jgi:hypothetical protein
MPPRRTSSDLDRLLSQISAVSQHEMWRAELVLGLNRLIKASAEAVAARRQAPIHFADAASVLVEVVRCDPLAADAVQARAVLTRKAAEVGKRIAEAQQSSV